MRNIHFLLVLWSLLALVGITRAQEQESDSSTRPAAATRPATRPAATLPAIYKQTLEDYLSGDWDALDKDLTKKELATLPRAAAADIAYIRQALGECRPVWWKQIKLARKMPFQVVLWTHTINLIYDPDVQGNSMSFGPTGNFLSATVGWRASDMDNKDDVGSGFTQGEQTSETIWTSLERVEIQTGFPPQLQSRMNNAERKQLEDYTQFRISLTTSYFGVPRARAWVIMRATESFEKNFQRNTYFNTLKPLGALVMVEVAAHPWRYPSLDLPTPPPPQDPAAPTDSIEQLVGSKLSPQFRVTLTFAEDKALREAIKAFAMANTTTVISAGRVMLPNKTQMDVNPDQDKELGKIRETWLRGQLLHPTTAPAAK